VRAAPATRPPRPGWPSHDPSLTGPDAAPRGETMRGREEERGRVGDWWTCGAGGPHRGADAAPATPVRRGRDRRPRDPRAPARTWRWMQAAGGAPGGSPRHACRAPLPCVCVGSHAHATTWTTCFACLRTGGQRTAALSPAVTMRTCIVLALVLATATVANGNLAAPFPFGAPQMPQPVIVAPTTLLTRGLARGSRRSAGRAARACDGAAMPGPAVVHARGVPRRASRTWCPRESISTQRRGTAASVSCSRSAMQTAVSPDPKP
jgi:hypothetical protein